MTREQKIDFIKSKIKKYGDISVGEMELDSSPCINSMGHYVHLVEYFGIDAVGTEICDTQADIEEYSPDIAYIDLEDEIIDEIYNVFVAFDWEDWAENQ